MADAGHIATDKLLKRLEKDVAREYKTAVKEMQEKLTAYLETTEEQRKIQEGLLKAGKITSEEYSNWCYRHTMVGKRWEAMRDTLAADMHHANEIALGITKDRMPDVYALNANYGTYQIEQFGIDTGFTLYNHDTAEYLLGDQRQLMPKPSTRKAAQIAANKDMQWNEKKIQSAVLQGVLQGESSYDVAKRLVQVGQMNYNSAVRYARTMTTSAQNAGRYQAFRRAKGLGVDLTIEWQATLDGRTRHDHRQMHGQRREVDEPFKTPDGYEILYPADCTGDSYELQSEIWNCRCTLISWVKGFEGDTVKSSPKMNGMTFEEWQNEHTPTTPTNAATTAATVQANTFQNVTGISDTYKAGMQTALENSPHVEAQQLYGKYADQLNAIKDSYKKGAFFRGREGGIYFDAASDAQGSSYQAKYETGFHEFGHMIDWLANGKKYTYLSNTPFNGKQLEDVIKSDFQAFKKSLGVSRAAEVIPILKAEHMSLVECGNISDILEKCTGQSYPLGIGHGTSYHKRQGATEREFFAEVVSSAVVNEASYKQLERLFPNAVKMVWEMARSVI